MLKTYAKSIGMAALLVSGSAYAAPPVTFNQLSENTKTFLLTTAIQYCKIKKTDSNFYNKLKKESQEDPVDIEKIMDRKLIAITESKKGVDTLTFTPDEAKELETFCASEPEQ